MFARTIEMLILDFMKFVVLEEDFPDFLARRPARFCSTTVASFPIPLHHMKPQRERSDGVVPGRLGVISSFRAHGKERLLPTASGFR